MFGPILLSTLAAAAPPMVEPRRSPVLEAELRELSWADAEEVVRTSYAERADALLEWSGRKGRGRETVAASLLSHHPSPATARAALEQALSAGDVRHARAMLPVVEAATGALPEAHRRLDEAELRSSWSWLGRAGLVALAVTLGLALGGRRRSGRETERARPVDLANPFVTGRPLRDHALVFGRDAVLKRMFEQVRDGRSVYLRGERRIGKTTLLLQLGDLLSRAGWSTVFVDVAGSRGAAARATLERALGAACRAAGHPTDGTYTEQTRRLAADRGLALLFDEVDALNHADADLRAEIRALCLEPGAPARMVGAGVGLRLAGDPESERWGAGLHAVDVGPLPDEIARGLLTQPLSGRVTWADDALSAVISASEGRPLRLQLHGFKLVERLLQLGTRHVTAEDAAAVRASVERAWSVIQELEIQEDLVPIDVDAAVYELGRLSQEIADLERALGDL